MRASNIGIVAIVSLSLAACSSVRTVNGVDVESSRSLCSGPVERCVLLAGAVIAVAGIGVGLATGLAQDRGKDRNLAAFAAAIVANQNQSAAGGGSTTGPTTVVTAPTGATPPTVAPTNPAAQ